tara:strand:- start:250 stop:486 length:237 start_codon:yes stop_codon:yes gene_type:complete
MAEDACYITQEQYDRWIKNMSKNKTGTSWVYIYHNLFPEIPPIRTKLYKNTFGLYWTTKEGSITYLEIKDENHWEKNY